MKYRRQKGSLIRELIGGIVGGIEGQKHPVQEIRSGRRKADTTGQSTQVGQGGSSGNGSGHGQERGVQYQQGQNLSVSGEGSSHSIAGTDTSTGKNEHAPPPYEPRQ